MLQLTFDDITSCLNILLTRHKYQYIPLRTGQVDRQDLLDSGIDIILAGRFRVEHLDGESTSRYCECSGVSEESGKLLGVHCSGSDDELQISSAGED